MEASSYISKVWFRIPNRKWYAVKESITPSEIEGEPPVTGSEIIAVDEQEVVSTINTLDSTFPDVVDNVESYTWACRHEYDSENNECVAFYRNPIAPM